MTTAEALAVVREALLEHSPAADYSGPYCGECGKALEGEHRPGCHTPAALAALALIEERLKQTDEVLSFLRYLIESEWGQSGPYTGSFEVVNEFVRALGGGE